MTYKILLLSFLFAPVLGCLQSNNSGSISEGEPIGLNVELQKWILNIEEPKPAYEYTSIHTYEGGETTITSRVNDNPYGGGCEIATTGPIMPITECLSILDYFELIDEAYERGAYNMVVFYDPVLGYPTYIYIDYVPVIADDEVIININVNLL